MQQQHFLFHLNVKKHYFEIYFIEHFWTFWENQPLLSVWTPQHFKHWYYLLTRLHLGMKSEGKVTLSSVSAYCNTWDNSCFFFPLATLPADSEVGTITHCLFKGMWRSGPDGICTWIWKQNLIDFKMVLNRAESTTL